MKLCRIAALSVMCAAVFSAANNSVTVEQVKSFVKSAIEMKNADKDVAAMLHTMKLTERLDAATVEDLQGKGAGPKTVAALKELMTESEKLPEAAPPPPPPVYVPPPSPSSEEQSKLLDEVKDYAINYTQRLPDFICLEQTRRYIDTTGREAWRLSDILTARLSYFNQREDYKLVSQNDKVVTDTAYAKAGGALSMGDFGTTMREIFESASHTHIEWERWATINKRRQHVLAYRVPLEYTKYSIASQLEEKGPEQTVFVGYHGEIFVDRELGTITRISVNADNIPATFPVQEAHEILDYEFTKIGDADFFLPSEATLRMHAGREWSKNVKQFRLYRKFSADAVIKFDSEELPKEDEKTKQQPPQQPPKQ